VAKSRELQQAMESPPTSQPGMASIVGPVFKAPVSCGDTHVQGVRLNHTILTREERLARVDACIAL